MSTLWTPGGEHPVGRPPEGAPAPAPAGPPGGPAQPGPTGPGDDADDEEMRAQMAALQEQLAAAPAEVVIANHAYSIFELAALHLSQRPPHLDQARTAIDAYAALVEGMRGRLGDAEPTLIDGLAQLRLAFVQISRSEPGSDGATPPPG